MKLYFPLILAVGLSLLCLLPLSSSFLGTYKQGTCVNVVTILNGTSVVNLTIYYPNQSIAGNGSMTKDGVRYSFDFCSTSTLGTYNYDYSDDTGGVYVNDFEVTPEGTKLTEPQGILYGIFSVIALFLFCLTLYGGIKLPFKNTRNNEGEIISVNDLKYAKVFLLAVSYVILLFLVGLLRGISAQFIFHVGISKFFNYFYWILLSFLYPLIVCSLLFALILFIQDKKLNKDLRRGIPTR